MARPITEKQAIKDLNNQVRVAKKWQKAGHSLEIIADGLWNKMAANVEVRNGKLLIWAQYPSESNFTIKATIS